ncbi:MAG: hypothetical protein KAJ51_05605, partial [Thermoplasmata archaeon]|nr:hypothetical protein [Thermoplasmata archaeon]
MRVQIKSYFVVIILILSALLVAMNFGYVATNTENEPVKTYDGLASGRQPGSGYHWGTLDPISEPFLKDDWNTFDSTNTRIAVEGGKIYVVWEDETPYQGCGGDDDIFFRYFDGDQWSDIQVISEPVFGEDENDAGSYNPDIAVENGKIYVVWHDMNDTYGVAGDRDIFFKCNLTGTNWEPVQVISEPTLSGNAVNTGQSYNPSIAVENGNIYIAWDDDTDYDNSGIDWDVFYRCNRSAPGWEDIQVISEPVPGDLLNDGASEYADIAVENGKIYVVWEDSNDTYLANIDDDIFFKCNLTGSNWETVQVISEPQPITDQNDLASNDPVIAVENGNIYVAWQDTSDINGASSTGLNDDIF